MNVLGGGLILVINYAAGGGIAAANPFALQTENNFDILTESSQTIDIEN